MSNFGLVRSFDIDDGELDGLTPQRCFVLGYELALIDGELSSPDQFQRTIHLENKERAGRACEKAGREHKFAFLHDDASENWVQLMVAAAPPA